MERFIELTFILLLGGMLFIDCWNWHAVAAALFLFFVAHPSVYWPCSWTRARRFGCAA